MASLRGTLGYPLFRSEPIEPCFLHCPVDCEIPRIFTDGSCYLNTDRHFSLAGSAFEAYRDVGCNDPFLTRRSLVPGQDHTSYRAEVYALLMVCQHFKHCIIYLDCQAAKSEMIFILEQISAGYPVYPNDHSDVWIPIITLVQNFGHTIQLIKVKAHDEHKNHNDPFLAWCSRCNAKVDKEAKEAVTTDAFEVFQLFSNKHNILTAQRKVCGEVLDFQVRAAHRSFQVISNSLIHDRATSIFAKGAIPTDNLVPWVCHLSEEQCALCKFNPIFLARVSEWASKLHWSLDPGGQITYVELMLSYIFDTGCYPPFPVLKYPQNPNSRAMVWLLKDQNPLRDFQGKHLGDILSGFIRCINWTEKQHLNAQIFPGEHKPDCTSLSRYGYKGLKVAGFKARPVLAKQHEVDQYCNKYFANRKVLDSPIP